MVNSRKIASETIVINQAKIVAFALLMTPVTNGRFDVRAINLSDSDSITMLNALDAPAANVPPMSVAATNPKLGRPF